LVGPGHVTPLVQVKVVPSEVQVVSGKPSKSLQLGPVQVNCIENPWLGPQDTRVPLAVVMVAYRGWEEGRKRDHLGGPLAFITHCSLRAHRYSCEAESGALFLLREGTGSAGQG
jgi:hypothetical protein